VLNIDFSNIFPEQEEEKYSQAMVKMSKFDEQNDSKFKKITRGKLRFDNLRIVHRLSELEKQLMDKEEEIFVLNRKVENLSRKNHSERIKRNFSKKSISDDEELESLVVPRRHCSKPRLQRAERGGNYMGGLLDVDQELDMLDREPRVVRLPKNKRRIRFNRSHRNIFQVPPPPAYMRNPDMYRNRDISITLGTDFRNLHLEENKNEENKEERKEEIKEDRKDEEVVVIGSGAKVIKLPRKKRRFNQARVEKQVS